MAFSDQFAQCMTAAGISVEEASVPDGTALGPAIDYLKSWLSGHDWENQACIDEVCAETWPMAAALADPELGAIDPSFMPLLQAFDAASGFSLSNCIEWCEHCVAQASQA